VTGKFSLILKLPGLGDLLAHRPPSITAVRATTAEAAPHADFQRREEAAPERPPENAGLFNASQREERDGGPFGAICCAAPQFHFGSAQDAEKPFYDRQLALAVVFNRGK